MSSPALTAVHRPRTNWIVTGFEGGLALLAVGVVLLYVNPFWHLNEAGFLDPRVQWWNRISQGAAASGLILLVLAFIACVAALISRCFRSRPLWPYVAAALAVAAVVIWAGLNGFTRDFQANFEWNAADGFNVFRVQGSQAPSTGAANSAWTWLVGLQVEPQLRGYFHLIDWQRANGHIGVTVTRMVPIAWPIELGNQGEVLEDPDETPLMQAADKGDLKTLQQLLAEKPDVNARDQAGQTALIHACQNPHASPELVKALLAAGADVNYRSRNDYSALSWAIARGNTAVLQVLRRAGAKP
ncbi:MAG: ankyrin repeat domain-containing protein [Acidobacteriaceae bacterium]|nr:ankyrin repeat domain-containing protein [Acidobacteriaceae bacterium]